MNILDKIISSEYPSTASAEGTKSRTALTAKLIAKCYLNEVFELLPNNWQFQALLRERLARVEGLTTEQRADISQSVTELFGQLKYIELN